VIRVFHDGRWHEGDPKILGAGEHAFWMASVAFDGARAFDGFAPDLDRHFERCVHSARAMLLEPTVDVAGMLEICLDGIRRFPPGAHLYIRPMFFARRGFVAPDPQSTDFCLVLHELPMPDFCGFSACFSEFRRPARDMAPTDAKASCLYPNMQRALVAARRRGFDNAITFDPCGNVAELATANLWIVKDGVALTPVWNGTFLNGITRQRVMALLREDGVPVEEAVLTREDVLAADEVFSTGNYGKVLPITRVEDRKLQVGPITRRARALYMDFAAGCRIA